MKQKTLIYILFMLMSLAGLVMIPVLIIKFFCLPLILISFLLFLNTTNFLHSEDDDYPPTELTRLMDPRAKPIFLINDQPRAILFIHGFPSSPAVYEYAAQKMEKAGFDVFVPLLPGFGTRPEDLIDKNFSQWYKFVKDLYVNCREKYTYFYIAGLSMGGSITLKLAEEFSDSPDFAPTGVICAAAPVFITNPQIYLARLAGWLKPYRPNTNPPWPDCDGDSAWLGYRGQFPLQAYSLAINLSGIKRDLGRITIPFMGMHAKGDKTVHFHNLAYILERIKSPLIKSRIFDLSGWKHTHHSLFLYHSIRDDILEEIRNFSAQCESFTQKNINRLENQ